MTVKKLLSVMKSAAALGTGICILLLAGASPIPAEDNPAVLRYGEITQVAGDVSIKKAYEDTCMKAFPGFAVSQYDMLKTGAGSSADIAFTQQGAPFKIRLKDGTHIGFGSLRHDEPSDTEDILLDLAVGDVLIRTEKLKPKSQFRVRTPTSIIGVRGTRFEVRYEPQTQ